MLSCELASPGPNIGDSMTKYESDFHIECNYCEISDMLKNRLILIQKVLFEFLELVKEDASIFECNEYRHQIQLYINTSDKKDHRLNGILKEQTISLDENELYFQGAINSVVDMSEYNHPLVMNVRHLFYEIHRVALKDISNRSKKELSYLEKEIDKIFPQIADNLLLGDNDEERNN